MKSGISEQFVPVFPHGLCVCSRGMPWSVGTGSVLPEGEFLPSLEDELLHSLQY